MELSLTLFHFILQRSHRSSTAWQRYDADRLELIETGTMRWLPGCTWPSCAL